MDPGKPGPAAGVQRLETAGSGPSHRRGGQETPGHDGLAEKITEGTMPNIQKLIASPGPRFILPMAGLLLLGLALNSTGLTLLGLVGAGFFAYFFRDPERTVPQDTGLIVSP